MSFGAQWKLELGGMALRSPPKSTAERDILLRILHGVADSSRTSLKIFIASRPDIGQEIKRTFKFYHRRSMNSSGLHIDIAPYVKDILIEKKENGDLKVGRPALIDEIHDALVKGAQGMSLWVAFQIQDICAQVCDDDIRKAIKNLAKDLPETYERSLNRIVNAGKVNVAQKVFRWVAAVQRPLSLEELREAIAVEPCQPFSKPERLVNDMNRLISWCGNLIILDEEEQVVQFAHHTVQQFFLSSSSTASNIFHFQFSEVNHEAGEVCVTYLNFNDFKKQLVRFPGTRPSLEPKAILKASLSAGLNKNISRSWSRLGRLWGYKTIGNHNLLRQLQDGAGFKDLGSLRKLQTHYPFLAYASECWLLHTADFVKESTRTWRLWSNLLNAENTLARTPWTFIEWTKRTRSTSNGPPHT
ncbi:MAG: hypothetical protein M1830_005559 [Pleopsidium flavum]|nr:MAG: hypothetical protein M1830_005559 [Pleopsidium flavum]